MWSLLVARMSRQISYDPMARRVMSSRPGPAACRRGGPPSLSETVAARAVEASCARCEVNDTTRSCSSASRAITCAPMRLSHMRNSSAPEVWSSASASGVRIQVRPRKRSPEAARAPRVSLPAMGCPPRNWARVRVWRARSTMAHLVLPASVTRAPGRSSGSRWRMVSRMRPIVWERKTRSASGTAACSPAPRSMAPQARASAMACGELTPVMTPSKPDWRKASPKDEPIRPVPTMTTFCMFVPCSERDRPGGPSYGQGDGLQLVHQLFELLGAHGLRAVGGGAIGVGMDFNHEAIGAGGQGGARHGSDDIAAAGAVRWVGDDGQVGEFLDDRDGGEIEGVARLGLEGADAALAEDDVVIAAGQDVLGGEQESRDAAVEQHGFGLLAEVAQQIEVLHIAGADLQDVHILREEGNLGLVHDFADHQQAVAVGGGTEHLQALGAEALELIRRTAGLECTAADDAGAGAGGHLGALLDLVAVLQAARAGHHDDGIAADGEGADAHDGAAGPKGAAGEFVGRDDAVGFLDTVHDLEDGEIEIVLAADAAKHGVDHAGGAVHVEAEIHQAIDDVLDLLFGGALLHDD